MMEERMICASKEMAGTPLYHFWNNCVGAGRAREGLRADWQRQLKTVKEACGFRYLRFHGLLCDEMGIYRVENGCEYYHWQYVDQLFDYLLSIGVRPFVEFGFMPIGLASGTTTMFWWEGNVTPPKDYDAWGRLLGAAVQHWEERYGVEEVRQWYFEIWNEPNLYFFWDGSRTEYFRLYESGVRAIKQVDDKLRVGGPATSNYVPDERFDGDVEDETKHKTHLVEDLQSLKWHGVWVKEFLAFASERNLSVDFVSVHPYPTDFALDGQQKKGEEMKGRTRYVKSVDDDIQWVRDVVDQSAYPNAEIHLTEWSSSPSSRDYSHDFLPEAAYIVRSNLSNIGKVNSLSYWVFTDIFEEEGPGPEDFHGGFGLISLQDIKKPAFHAYRMLNALGEEWLDRGEDYIVTRTKEGKLSVLVCNYGVEDGRSVPMSTYPDYHIAEDFQNEGKSRKVHIRLENVTPGQRFQMEILDVHHGCAATAWKELGYPTNLNKEQKELIQKAAEQTQISLVHAGEDGVLDLKVTLGGFAVMTLKEMA